MDAGKPAPAHIHGRHVRGRSSADIGGAASFMLGAAASIAIAAIVVAMPSAAAAEDEQTDPEDGKTPVARIPEDFREGAPMPQNGLADGGGQGCEHAWMTTTETIRHPEVSHQVEHEPVYKETLVGHTVCNECGETIDGRATSHLSETGHSGYTTKVPVLEYTLVTDGWTETVVDSEEWAETVSTGAECVLCGERREAL